MHTMQLILLLVLLWTSNPYIRKHLLKTVPATQFQMLLNLWSLVLNASAIEYKHVFNQWILLSILNTYFASYIFNTLTSTMSVSDFIPIVQPMVIVMSLCIDAFFFNKNVSYNNAFGSLLIVLGIVIFNQ